MVTSFLAGQSHTVKLELAPTVAHTYYGVLRIMTKQASGDCKWTVKLNDVNLAAIDLWADHWRGTRTHGDVIIVCYADDIVVGFQNRSDAERFREELQERCRRFNLELHADKTRLIEFGRFATERRQKRGDDKPETFDFLGFTHICAKTRRGGYVVLRHTMRKRRVAKLREIRDQLRRRIHGPVREVGQWLRLVLQGYYRYYVVPWNYPALQALHHEVKRLWYRSFRRRSQKTRVTWKRMSILVERWLPPPRILHPYPEDCVSL